MQASARRKGFTDLPESHCNRLANLIPLCVLAGMIGGCADLGSKQSTARGAESVFAADSAELADSTELIEFDEAVSKLNEEVGSVRDELMAAAPIDDAARDAEPAPESRTEITFEQPEGSAESESSLDRFYESSGYATASGARAEPAVTWSSCGQRVPGAGYRLSEVNPRRSAAIFEPAVAFEPDGCNLAAFPLQFEFEESETDSDKP